MGKVHRQYSPTFKVKVVLEAIREEEKNLFIEELYREIGELKMELDWLSRCSKDDAVTFAQRSL